jgi:hypothetical protein
VTYSVGLSKTLSNTIPLDAPGLTSQALFAPVKIPQLNVANIACSSAVQLSANTFQYNFATVQSPVPFIPGQDIYGIGFTNSFYNGGWNPIGVVSCTTSNVTVKSQSLNPSAGNSTTGNVYATITNTNNFYSTDCNSKVTTVNNTDRVFISAQLNNTISYVGSGDLTYSVFLNRWVGFLTNSDPGNPIYRFNFDQTISQKIYQRSGLTGPGTLAEIESIFSTAVDNPTPGYYWYIVEAEFSATGNLSVSQSTLGVRSISTQVVKQ